MADLQFHVSDLKHIPGCVLVKMAGAIDASTVLTFQQTLENLRQNGVTRFLLDMEGIKYVNSTGLGSLVRLADQMETEGGGFALVKIHPKVKVVFDMLGLNAFFKILGSLEEAEAYLRSQGAGAAPGRPAASQARSSAPPPPPPPPPGRQQQRGGMAPPPPPPPPPGRPAPMTAMPASPSQQAPAGGVEPRVISCQNCGAMLKIGQAGTFKCSRCFTVFNVAGNGQVEFQVKSKPTPLQMNLTCAEECREGLLLFLGAVSRRAGFDQNRTQQLQQAVSEIVHHITQDAYGNNPQNTYSVLIAPMAGEMNIKFADHGRPIDGKNASLFRFSRQVMTMFDVKPHPQGGNIVTVKMPAY